MKFGKKRTMWILLFVGAMLLSSFGSAYAAVTLEPIKAFFNKGVSFVLYGERWQPKDAFGKALNAIYYEGTNYLPARAIAEALEIPIEFDPNTQVIYIGGKPGDKTPIFAAPMEIDNVYAVLTKDPAETKVKDTQYKEVLKIDQYGDAVFTLDRKFKRLVLHAAVLESGEHEVEFTSYNAGELAGNAADAAIETHTVSPDDPVTELVFGVEGLDKVRIHVQSHHLNPYIYARILDTSYFDNGEGTSR